jgi:hypothetical protein
LDDFLISSSRRRKSTKVSAPLIFIQQFVTRIGRARIGNDEAAQATTTTATETTAVVCAINRTNTNGTFLPPRMSPSNVLSSRKFHMY